MAGALYLEAGHVPLPAGSPPPRLRAASRDALCWSKTSKNEASGPMGAKAMNTDVTETDTPRAGTRLGSERLCAVPAVCALRDPAAHLSRAFWPRDPLAHAHTSPRRQRVQPHAHSPAHWEECACAQGSVSGLLTRGTRDEVLLYVSRGAVWQATATAGYAWDGDRDVLEMVLLFCCSMGLFSFFFFFFYLRKIVEIFHPNK